MNPQDPLAALHPLREPSPIGWWPPAPGWWAVAGVCLLALLLLGYVLWRRYRANAYRRKALARLEQLWLEQRRQPDLPRFLGELNTLLKAVAITAYPRRELAACSGDKWLAFLNASLRENERLPREFVSAAYRREPPQLDVAQLHRGARAWITRHRRAA
ncbi:MAG: DUF4381 domain-containing protein [Pseudomonadales bacterium]|nr:DUF4381 domain-containing protein [Pseudomonadales bacterium]